MGGSRRERLSEEPPDDVWMEEEAARRREVWEREKPQRDVARRASREREPLGRRVHALEVQLTLSATQAAGKIASSGGGPSAESGLPPAAVQSYGGEHPAELHRLWRLLGEVVRRIEAMAEGAGGSRAPLETEEVDRILLGLEGHTPDECSMLEPRLGSPEAVRRARRRLGLKAKDGAAIIPSPTLGRTAP